MNLLDINRHNDVRPPSKLAAHQGEALMKKSRGLDAWRGVAKVLVFWAAEVPDSFSTASSGPCSSSASSPVSEREACQPPP